MSVCVRERERERERWKEFSRIKYSKFHAPPCSRSAAVSGRPRVSCLMSPASKNIDDGIEGIITASITVIYLRANLGNVINDELLM